MVEPLKAPNIEDELADTLAKQKWLETQEFAESQAQQPETASQPQTLQMPEGDAAAATGATGQSQQTMQTTAAPNPNAPPAPPPPPPPLAGQIQSFASDWLNQPNRYLSDFAQAQRAASEARLARVAEEEKATLDERMSQRGLDPFGGGIGTEARGRLSQRLYEAASQDEAQMLELLATHEGMDRLRAGQFGVEALQSGIPLQALELERDKLTQRESEFARSFGLDERQFAESQNRFIQEIALSRDQLASEDARWRAALEDNASARALERDLRNRAMDIQESGQNADNAFRQAALDQERDLTLAAQDLEKYGIDAESAFRYASLDQDAEFQQKRLDLEKDGIEREDAYRYAALEENARQAGLDFDIRDRALDLEKKGMELDEAYRQSELDLREQISRREDETRRLAVLVQALSQLQNQPGKGLSSKQIQEIMRSLGLNVPTDPTPGGGEGDDGRRAGDGGRPGTGDRPGGGGTGVTNQPGRGDYPDGAGNEGRRGVTDLGRGDYPPSGGGPATGPSLPPGTTEIPQGAGGPLPRPTPDRFPESRFGDSALLDYLARYRAS